MAVSVIFECAAYKVLRISRNGQVKVKRVDTFHAESAKANKELSKKAASVPKRKLVKYGFRSSTATPNHKISLAQRIDASLTEDKPKPTESCVPELRAYGTQRKPK